ncbi:hypothetical protein MAJJADAN_00037 [Pseudomonas phage Amjad_SA]|nr:hypothetical protein MAJJADAN_00037 [Pseudomonas phage Amjad_SA]
MVSSFQRRRLRVTFQLATGSFLEAGDPDTVVLEDFRTEVEIDAPGGYEFATCRLRIYGVERFTMDRLTVINYQNLDFMRNSMLIEATDDAGQFTAIFFGEIYAAQPDFSGVPDVPFVAEARSGLIGSLSPAAANSFPGAQRVSAIMSRLARELGVALEDNGVTSTVTDMYLAGPPLTKVQTLANAARIQYWFVPEQGLLAIAPMGVGRRGTRVPYNFNTGLVGYPTKTHVGVAFTALFNPAAFHGGPILLESDVSACNGEWYIVSMSHRLSANMPGGPWFTHFIATPENTTIRSR